MTDALTGMACGVLAASALLGLAFPTPPVWRGARLSGAVGALLLLLALMTHAVQAMALPDVFDSAGRALTIALVGLGMAWSSRRSFAPDTCWALGLAAALAGWAEFAPHDNLPLSVVAGGLVFLLAAGAMVAASSRALAAVYTRDRRWSVEASITLALALGMLAMFILSAQHFIAAGSLWLPTPIFKAVTAACLGLFANRLLQERPIVPWLTVALALVVVGISIAPGAWSAG